MMQWLFSGMLVLLAMSTWSYDPMAPPGYNKGTIDNAIQSKTKSKKERVSRDSKNKGFSLRQIVISGLGKSAVINGYIVNEGSYVNNAYVKEIRNQSVILQIKGKTRTLTLEETLPRVRR
jgi:type II secretory pathway component PulC